MVEHLGFSKNRILRYYDKSIFEIHDDIIKVIFRFVPGFEDDLQPKLQSENDSTEDLQSNLDSKSNS